MLGIGLAAIPMLAACTQDGPTATSRTDPVRRESLGDELSLVALYEAAIDRQPDLQALLEPILTAHKAHADALREGLPDPQSPVPTPAPTLKVDVLAQLREAERLAVGLRSGACTRTTDGELASLLCLISASEAQHVTQLAAAP
jgi:hypothetical protein